MKRIAVVGPSGSGKSTTARALGQDLGLPTLELDGPFHQANWTELDPTEFRARVAAFIEQDGWVVDGNYARARDLVLARADTVVWLRLPRGLVMRQAVQRTVTRLISRQELWNGNRESVRNVLSLNPETSILAWAWKMHGKYDFEYAALQAAAQDQTWVVLTSRQQVKDFLSASCAAGRA